MTFIKVTRVYGDEENTTAEYFVNVAQIRIFQPFDTYPGCTLVTFVNNKSIIVEEDPYEILAMIKRGAE